MKATAFLSLLCMSFASICSGDSTTNEPLTLDDCFKAAVKQSELLATQHELVTQADETYLQSKAALLPVVNGVGSYQVQQNPAAGVASSFPKEQTTLKLTASQPLFRGLREYAAITQKNLQLSAARSQKQKAAQQLYTDVAQVFYLILSLEQNLKNLSNEISIHQKRIEELNARIHIGRSQLSEVLSTRTMVETLEAQMESVRAQLQAARESFTFLTGLTQNTALLAQSKTPEHLEDINAFLTQLEQRPDIKAAHENYEASDQGIPIARGAHFPSLDLLGNYYLKRPGVLSSVDWDIAITGTLPLFAGGAISSQVRQATSIAKASELNLIRTRRQAEQEIRTLYSNAASDLLQLQKLERATKTAFENFNVQSKNYKLGLVTNLDVLQATTSSQQSLRNLDAIKYQVKFDFLKLEIAAARAPKTCEEASK